MNNYILFFIIILLIIYYFSISNNCNYEKYYNLWNRSGSEPKYEPGKWNKLGHKLSHNCYEYALNDYNNKDAEKCLERINYCRNNKCYNNKGKELKTPREICSNLLMKSQPGYYRGFSRVSKNEKNCDTYINRTLLDNPEIYMIPNNSIKCQKGYYKISLVSAPGQDYHYYRQDKDGYWSHKNGEGKATNLDSSGNLIIDPKYCNRQTSSTRNYSDFCGYFCVPSNKLVDTKHSDKVIQ